MIRLAIAIALLPLTACFQSHPTGQKELGGQDCYNCHTSDYEATTAPIHRDTPQVFSTACANCHRQISWQPALEGIHGDLFGLIEGPHTGIACLDCHDLAAARPSKLGANTNCIQCHPDDASHRASHQGATLLANQPYSYNAQVPNFCLECHPAGAREKHPDDLYNRYAVVSGVRHHAVLCSECHDRTAGPDTKGLNVTCVEARCHHTVKVTDYTKGHEDSDRNYWQARGTGSDRTFCHKCH